MFYVYDFPVALKRGNIDLVDSSLRIIIYKMGEHSYVVPAGSIVNPINENYDSMYPDIVIQQRHVNRKLLCVTRSISFYSLSEAISFVVGFDTSVSKRDCTFCIQEGFKEYFKALIWGSDKDEKCVWRVPDIIPHVNYLKGGKCVYFELFGCEEKNNAKCRFDLQSVLMLLSYTHKGDELKELVNNAILADSFYNPS